MGKSKTAIITGITGQDGSYLAELLLSKGYEVIGVMRRHSQFSTARIDHLMLDPELRGRFNLEYGDLLDSLSLVGLLTTHKPDEFYNLGAQSHVAVSFKNPHYTCQVNALGTLNVLEAIRVTCPSCRLYQASSSEMFGKVQAPIQNEETPFYPRSPYGVSKIFGYWMVVNYREAYGMFASNGILFNHESPRRGGTFVTAKIVNAAVDIFNGRKKQFALGNLDAKRDWGHAKDYVEMQWRILQHSGPDDFVIATGQTHSVRYFAEHVFDAVGIEIMWSGAGINEVGSVSKINRPSLPALAGMEPQVQIGQQIISVSEQFFRAAEVDLLQGDSSKANRILDWTPQLSLRDLITDMLEDKCNNDAKPY